MEPQAGLTPVPEDEPDLAAQKKEKAAFQSEAFISAADNHQSDLEHRFHA